MEKRFTVKIGDENISVVRFSKDDRKADFVFLHGAGDGNKKRIDLYQQALVDAGHAVLAFDFSGQGESSGKLAQSSLAKRVSEAKTIINQYADIDNLTISGSSMGAYIAIKMLEFFKVKNLILFCPGVYDKQAFNTPFGEEFTKQIRKHESWKNTDIVEHLQHFRGKFLLIIGDKDEVIPKGVVEMLGKAVLLCSQKEFLVIPGAPHKITFWLAEHPQELELVRQKIVQYSNY